MTAAEYDARRVRDKYRQELPDYTVQQPQQYMHPQAPAPMPAQTTAPQPLAEAAMPAPAPDVWSEPVQMEPQAPAPTPQRPVHASAPPPRETSAPFGEALYDEVRSGRTEPAQRGWQGWMNRTLKTKIGKGADELVYDKSVGQIQRKLRTSKRVAILSGKGASGKTTVTLGLGSTIASKSLGTPVVAMSIDPLGNLARRVNAVSANQARSVMSLAADTALRNVADVGSYLVNDKSGLKVLGSSTTDGAGVLTENGFDRAAEVLAEYNHLTLVDFGLNFDSRTYHHALQQVDQFVLATAITTDSVNELYTLIEALSRFDHYRELLANAVVVFVKTRTGNAHLDVEQSRNKILSRYPGMTVISIPFDEHIAEGGAMSLDLLNEETRLSFVWLAAEVMNRLPSD